ncbi:MAG: PIN domain-containing protein [Deltaproteobacteria bacterium]|nr:PIN domain-containing protein [Deltaproteobacteria bacterium]
MIAVDTNILVHAHRAEAPDHRAALQRLTELATGAAAWAIPGSCLVEFLRVITHPRVLRRPHTLEEAQAAVRALLASPTLHVLWPTGDYLEVLLSTVADGRATGNLVYDAQVVALCRAHGVRVILSEDRDMRRFSSIRSETLAAR